VYNLILNESTALDFNFFKHFPVDSYKDEKNESQRFIPVKKTMRQTIEIFNLKINPNEKNIISSRCLFIG
jgi:hypothetical protein